MATTAIKDPKQVSVLTNGSQPAASANQIADAIGLTKEMVSKTTCIPGLTV
jgi:hypothetical protein